MKPPRSELAFASFLAYCPRGDTKEAKRAKNFVVALKENRVFLRSAETASVLVARRLRERDDVDFRERFLGSDRALVPVPRSGLRRPGALWPALEIAEQLHARRFGSAVVECLHRRVAVPKAATAAPEDRPNARTHFNSLALIDPLVIPAKVTLVDDVVTRGSQLFGAAWRIWAARRDVDVCAFAVVRTVSVLKDFKDINDVCEGLVHWRGGACRRRP